MSSFDSEQSYRKDAIEVKNEPTVEVSLSYHWFTGDKSPFKVVERSEKGNSKVAKED